LTGVVSPISANRFNPHADLTVGFLRPLLGGAPDFTLEEEVTKLRNKGLLTTGSLNQISMVSQDEDLEEADQNMHIELFRRSLRKLSGLEPQKP